MLPILCISQGQGLWSESQLRSKCISLIPEKIEFQISSQYTDEASGTRHVYVQQTIDQMPLLPVTAGFHFDRKNQLIYTAGNLIDNFQSLIKKSNHLISIEHALKSVVLNKSEQLQNLQFILRRAKPDAYHFTEYKCSSLAKDEIKVKRCYYLLNPNLIVSAFQVFWKRNLENEWLEIILDASSAEILYEHNHLLQCNFESMAFERKSLFRVSKQTTIAAPPNSYRVYPIPTESPIHGSRGLVTSPWSKASNASPLGWHNDGLNLYYSSRGNNVDAYEDSDDDDLPTGGDAARAYGGGFLNFDFPLDPGLSPLQNKNASITNLFYWCNLMHDVWYQYGFHEAAGNFQNNNFNKGGMEYDQVISEGIDNLYYARNNANFGTPPDGYSGVMQLYVWQPPEKDTIIIETPPGIAGKIMYVHASITPAIYAPINKQVVKVDDGSLYPSFGCNNLINAVQINGKIALIDKGICSFVTKMIKAQNAGAVAVIICNSDDNEPAGFGGWTTNMTVPSVNIRKSDCDKIKLQLQNGVYVTILPSAALQFKVNQRSYVFSRANYGAYIPNTVAPIIIAYDNANVITDACDVLTNGNDLNGKIALIDDGNCQISYKALQVQNFGAIAVIICKQGGGYPDTIPKGSNWQSVHIPIIELSNADCQIIKANLPSNGQFINQLQQLTDGDFDAGIICHEYTHGISTRLTGGPGNSSCLGNAEQMGEGWSDYFALIMTMKPTDNGYVNRGIGLYNSGHNTTGVGLRPYPYNVNLAVNPADYSQLPDIIKISQPHGIGYIWCSMIWDMTWAMVKQFGIESDIYNANSNKGNNMAYHLVVDGMKLQPCSPGFVDARNAILKADTILYGGVHSCLLWNVFARRGLGFSANQGSSTRRDDGTAAYNLPPGCQFMSEQELFLGGQLAGYDLKLTAHESDDAIELNWNIDKQLKSNDWELVRKTERHINRETVIGSSQTSSRSLNKFIDHDANSGITYYYQLRVLNSKDEYLHTDWISASIKSDNIQWSCYPNPVTDQLIITTSIPDKSKIELKLYNGLLQQLDQSIIDYKPGDRITLDCKSLSQGHYYLLCGIENTYTCLRFFKN